MALCTADPYWHWSLPLLAQAEDAEVQLSKLEKQGILVPAEKPGSNATLKYRPACTTDQPDSSPGQQAKSAAESTLTTTASAAG
jgi:hypothetical protein